MALFLVFFEIATAKTALLTYLRMTFNGNYVGLAKITILRELYIIQLLVGTAEAIEVGAGAITKLISLE